MLILCFFIFCYFPKTEMIKVFVELLLFFVCSYSWNKKTCQTPKTHHVGDDGDGRNICLSLH